MGLGSGQPDFGALYEWDDGDATGGGTIDDTCPTSSAVCTVNFEPNDPNNGKQQFMLAQEEAGRVKSSCLESPSNSDSDSSSGIEDDCAVDVMQQGCVCGLLSVFVA